MQIQACHRKDENFLSHFHINIGCGFTVYLTIVAVNFSGVQHIPHRDRLQLLDIVQQYKTYQTTLRHVISCDHMFVCTFMCRE